MGGTDYNATVGNLGVGDTFRLEQHSLLMTVARIESSVDGVVRFVSIVNGRTETLQTYRRCFLVSEAPRCRCGGRYEHCDRDCPWPDALEAAYESH